MNASELFLGGFIGFVSSLLTGVVLHFLNRAHQDSIQRRELAIRLAIEKSRIDHETQKFMNERRGVNMTIMNDPRVELLFAEFLDFADAVMKRRRKQWWQRLGDKLGFCW